MINPSGLRKKTFRVHMDNDTWHLVAYEWNEEEKNFGLERPSNHPVLGSLNLGPDITIKQPFRRAVDERGRVLNFNKGDEFDDGESLASSEISFRDCTLQPSVTTPVIHCETFLGQTLDYFSENVEFFQGNFEPQPSPSKVELSWNEFLHDWKEGSDAGEQRKPAEALGIPEGQLEAEDGKLLDELEAYLQRLRDGQTNFS